MPTRTQVYLCWALFTGVMAFVSVVLRAVVPPTMGALQDAIGVGPLGVVMLAVWMSLTVYGFRPLLARWLARRRHSRVRQG